jgi:predicted heme/steroid binding protein
MLELTQQELARYDGRDGRPGYIAYKGRIYDVTLSYHWRGGRHHFRHHAGTDLTGALDGGPHGAYLLERVPQVGILVM